MNEKLGIVIPVYNEADAIASVLDKWRAMLERLCVDYRIYAYNDGSRDDSLKILRERESLFGGRLIVVDKPNSGHGPTVLAGYRRAAADGCDWIFQVDSDDEIAPEYFPLLWEAREDNDFIVGRRKHGPRVFARKIVSSVSRLAVRMFYGQGIYDVNVPYRLMRARVFSGIFDAMPDALFAPNVVIAGMAARSGMRFEEVPVDVRYRTTGVCSLNHTKLLCASIRSFAQTIFCAFRGRVRVTGLSWAAVLAGMFCMGTNPFVNAMRGADEAVFVYVGQAIRRGLLPYRDVFDHKGPLLYLFNWLGLTIGDGETWGIWLIECVLLVIACFTLLRMGERVFHVDRSRYAIFPYLILLFCSTCSGNICETYSIFFIVIAMGVLYKGIGRPLHAFVFGACLASIIMMKFVTVAIAAVWGCLLIEAVWRKRYLEACRATMCAGIGFLAVVTPFLICLGMNGILGDFWDVYIRFNMDYGRNCTVNSDYQFFGRATIPVFVAVVLNVLAIVKSKEAAQRRVMKLNLVLLLVSIGLIVGINARWTYYYLPIYPACFLPFSYFFVLMGGWAEVHKWCCNILACLGVGIMLFLDFRAAVYVTHYAKLILDGHGVMNVLSHIRVLSYDEVLPFKQHIADPTSVTVMGNNCQIYRTLNVTTPWRYPYQQPICWSSKKINDEIKMLIQDKKSRYIILNHHDKFKHYEADIKKNYTEIACTQSYTLLERREAY